MLADDIVPSEFGQSEHETLYVPLRLSGKQVGVTHLKMVPEFGRLLAHEYSLRGGKWQRQRA